MIPCEESTLALPASMESSLSGCFHLTFPLCLETSDFCNQNDSGKQWSKSHCREHSPGEKWDHRVKLKNQKQFKNTIKICM